MKRTGDLRDHRESASVEYRAQAAVVTDMNRMVRGIRRYLDAPSLRAALGAMDRRMKLVRSRPDATLAGTISDVLVAGDILARWHSVRHALPAAHAFAEAFSVTTANPSSWVSHRFVQAGADYLASKNLMTPTQYAALRDGYRNAGFSIAGQTEMDALFVARRSVARSLTRGYPVEQAGKALNDALKRAGYDSLQPWHARLVAQMNYATAYGAGSWEQLRNPRIRGIIPAFRYVTMHDSRVRPEHAAMHDKVFPRNHPIWTTWWPPNGYNCRCRVVGVNARTWNAMDGEGDSWPRITVEQQDGTTKERAVRPDTTADGGSFAGNPSRYLRAQAKKGRK